MYKWEITYNVENLFTNTSNALHSENNICVLTLNNEGSNNLNKSSQVQNEIKLLVSIRIRMNT